MKLSNKIKGAKNQLSGASAESKLKAWCNSIGIELIKKDPAIAITRFFSDGSFIGRFKAKSKPDFYGNLNGQYIEIECKSVDSDSFQYSKLPTHQRDSLIAATLSGGLGLLAIFFQGQLAVFKLPHDQFKPGKSIRVDTPDRFEPNFQTTNDNS